MKLVYSIIILFFSLTALDAQDEDKPELLLTDLKVQLECTEAVDSLYNFNFLVAEKQFGWIKEEYPDHPLGDFLMALSQWWRIRPNDEVTTYDEKFFKHVDESIKKGKVLYKKDKKNPEASFFLAAAYGFKATRLAELGKIRAAIGPGDKAQEYIRKNIDLDADFSPEFLFGRGLYNYFREWIPKNKPRLKPIFFFFKKGDMKKGVEQLEKVSEEAFYTRVEASVYLMDIYFEYGVFEDNGDRINTNDKALEIAKELYTVYPNNKYFERRFAEISLKSIQTTEKLQGVALMEKALSLENQYPGTYDRKTLRNFNYHVGIHYHTLIKKEKAATYFKKMLAFSEELDILERAYSIRSAYHIATYAVEESDKETAIEYFELIEDNYSKSNSNKNVKKWYKEAKKYLKENREKKFLGIF